MSLEADYWGFEEFSSKCHFCGYFYCSGVCGPISQFFYEDFLNMPGLSFDDDDDDEEEPVKPVKFIPKKKKRTRKIIAQFGGNFK